MRRPLAGLAGLLAALCASVSGWSLGSLLFELEYRPVLSLWYLGIGGGAVFAILAVGFSAFPLVLVGAPAGLGLGFLVAGMGGATWSRLTAVLYCAGFLAMVWMFLIGAGW